MSREKSLHQAQRWLVTAEDDLATAKILLREGSYAHACFHAQQAGEKAVKALWYRIDSDPWGHSIQKLVQEFPEREELPDRDRWIEQAAMLDKFYIPTRYPRPTGSHRPQMSTGRAMGNRAWRSPAPSWRHAARGWRRIDRACVARTWWRMDFPPPRRIHFASFTHRKPTSLWW